MTYGDFLRETEEEMTFEKFQASKIMFNDPGDENEGESPTMGCYYQLGDRNYVIDWQEGAFWECSEFFPCNNGEVFSSASLEEVEKWLYEQIRHNSC